MNTTEHTAMDTEIVIDTDEDGDRAYVEIGVQDTDTVADLHIEDADTAVEIRLNADEIRNLIASLETALATIEANA